MEVAKAVVEVKVVGVKVVGVKVVAVMEGVVWGVEMEEGGLEADLGAVVGKKVVGVAHKRLVDTSEMMVLPAEHLPTV